jgi:flagellar biogenesis protein FliO
MRTFIALARIAVVGCAAAPSFVSAQQAAPQHSHQFTPLVASEPQTFPAPRPIDARPLESTHTPPRRAQPPVNFRQVSAEEPVASPAGKAPLRLAPRSQANRQPTARPATPSPASALTTIAGSLGVVLAVFLVIVCCSRRFSPAGANLLPKEAVELLGRAPLSARQQMQLVRVGNKLLLVTLSATDAQTLTEITEPTEVEHLTAICRRGQPASASAAFKETLAQLASEPATAGFAGAPRPTTRGAR